MARTASTRMFHRLVRFLADNPGMKTLPEITAGLNYTYTYVIAPYLWRAKQFGAEIVPHKNGRTVLGYELVNGPEMLAALASFNTGAVKTPKAKKNAKAGLVPVTAPVPAPATPKAIKTKPLRVKAVKPVAVESDSIPTVSSKPVDILDEIDTDLVSYEDKSFAESYVKAL
jgi:hypothetical protein